MVEQIRSFYRKYLGREPTAADIRYWSNVAKKYGISAVERSIANSPEARTRRMRMVGKGVVEAKIREFYRKYLGREPSKSALRYWTAAAKRWGFRAVERSIANSPEARARRMRMAREAIARKKTVVGKPVVRPAPSAMEQIKQEARKTFEMIKREISKLTETEKPAVVSPVKTFAETRPYAPAEAVLPERRGLEEKTYFGLSKDTLLKAGGIFLTILLIKKLLR